MFSEEDMLKIYLWTRLNLEYKLPTMDRSESITLDTLLEKLKAMDWPEFELTILDRQSHIDKYFFFGIAMGIISEYGGYWMLHNENRSMMRFVHTPPNDVTRYDYYTIGKRFGKQKLTTLFNRYLKEFKDDFDFGQGQGNENKNTS